LQNTRYKHWRVFLRPIVMITGIRTLAACVARRPEGFAAAGAAAAESLRPLTSAYRVECAGSHYSQRGGRSIRRFPCLLPNRGSVPRPTYLQIACLGPAIRYCHGGRCPCRTDATRCC